MIDRDRTPDHDIISMPEDLDPRTIRFITSLWVGLIGGAQAEESLIPTPTRPDFHELKGEELSKAVKELLSTGPGSVEHSLGNLAVISRAVDQFGLNLVEMLEKNPES